MMIRSSVVALLAFGPAAGAQWDPANAHWGKSDPADLRVMTWNSWDRLCSSNNKVEGRNGWCALARIVAAIRPDVLILQECGDNSGNGTGSGIDSVANLATTIDMFLHGGVDSFNGGTEITSWVQKYAPGYDLEHVFVSADNDGFNRNVILSRHPFADLNGDGRATIDDVPFMFADGYNPGGDGVIRGYAFAEIDLPDGAYAGDLVVGNGHLRSGGDQADHDERVTAARRVAYYIDYLFNGAGTGVPDPNGKIRDIPAAASILGPETPVVWGGDWNEDEQTNGTKGPADWMALAEDTPGTDGTDRDRTDSIYDDAREFFSNDRRTHNGGSKLDYLCREDSLAVLRRAWTFHSSQVPSQSMPPELVGFPGGAVLASTTASDHRPVVADLILPPGAAEPPGAFELVSPAHDHYPTALEPVLEWTASAGADAYEVTIATDELLADVIHQAGGISATAYPVPGGVLSECAAYYWGVAAENEGGRTGSTPASRRFRTVVPADFDGNGILNVFDFLGFQTAFGEGDLAADYTGDGNLNVFDFLSFQTHFSEGC